jgi:acyl-CoA hydrolase
VRRRCLEATQLKVTSATFTYVAIDENRNKRPVPPEE